MRFLLFASFWAHWSFISAAPTNDLFALGPDEPVSNGDLQSFGDGSGSWDLGFNSGVDQNSNYLPGDSMFGSTNLASSITDTSGADPNAFTSADDLFGLDNSADLISLQQSCGATDSSSVPSDILTARDAGGRCSAGENQNQNQLQLPSFFQDPEGALSGTEQKPEGTPGQQPVPKDPDEGKTIRQLLWEDGVRFFQNIGGDKVKCPADVPSRCCTYAASDSGLPETPLLAVFMACLPIPPTAICMATYDLCCRWPKPEERAVEYDVIYRCRIRVA